MAPDVLLRLRRTPPRRLPGKLARFAVREARARQRRWAMRRQRGELTDDAFLRALGGRFANMDAAVRHFRTRPAPAFFVTPVSARECARQLADAYPDQAERLRSAAQQVLAHVVDLLGSGPVPLGPRIPWHTDFKTGFTWPLDLFEDIDYPQLDTACDVKVPWELSRCYHWVTLGRAYALDGDPRYAAEVAIQLRSWLEDNPWPFGVNWGRAMEVSERAVNWLWTMALFGDAPEIDDALYGRWLKSLLQHGRYIYENLEFSDNNGNHYLSNGVGLSYLGLLLPELSDSVAWRAKGQEIMWGELQRQVHPDGVDFEKGLGYQGLVLEFWYSVLLLERLNGISQPLWVLERLERMWDFMLAYTRPDGTFPQIGDNDDGRLANLDEEPVGSHRRHLAVGGALLGRGDLLAAAGDAVQTALWLLGPDVLPAPRTPRAIPSQAFPLGGFYVLRDEDAVMVVDAGEVGMNGIGAHGHNDLLSFELWAGGAPLLVDPGTHTYTADPAMRERLRSTRAHNTVCVDSQEIARLGGTRWLWTIWDDAHPTVERWESNPERDFLAASHDGYLRLPRPVTHRRTIAFEKSRRLWRMTDEMLGEGEHQYDVLFHLASPEILVETGEDWFRLRAPHADLVLLVLDAPAGTRLQREDGWVSRGYGHVEPAPVLTLAARAAAPAIFRYVLALIPRDMPIESVRLLADQTTSGAVARP